MASGPDRVARGVGSAASSDGPCETDDGFNDVLESFRTLSAEFKRLLRRQTYVFLVGVAMLFTPIYLALFAGLGA
ncbi:MAG: hypothetical protein OXH28_00375 [bacterium]|nr:hypothetical protein [bacterium]MXV90521.1 hypothetical protein [Acidimicrobiia bacterium]MYI19062.1 hypothetical protein [Acidimicrobiia bacterium]